MDTHGATALAKIEKETSLAPTVAGAAGMSPVVLAVLAQNPDAATLRECLNIQREYDREEARKQFTVAFVRLKMDLPKILAHDKSVSLDRGKTVAYTHTSLGGAVEAVVPHLINYGFAHSWTPSTDENGQVVVTCELLHIGGHSKQATLKAAPDAKGSKSSAQAVQSSVTSLERYTLLAVLGIATGDMGEPRVDQDEKQEERQPTGDQPPPDDKALNARAVRWLMDQRILVASAEHFIGRKVAEWTQADRARLKPWATKKPAAHDSTCPAATGGDLCDCGAAEQPPSE
jgi:hypothetical protein